MALSLRRSTALVSFTLIGIVPQIAAAQDYTGDGAFVLDEVLLNTFEEEVLQSLGVSEISADEIAEMPVTNDISELVRKQPGVNLTGASASGQRGNQRQIDIRGMGPDNTLILIDGRPVLSRNAVKLGRGGERDSRGDSNWVAPELIERIEVIRGPAAARYGSGAAGGVVNIVTKQPVEESFSVNLMYEQPQSALEGNTVRANAIWMKPINDRISLRFTANANRTGADDPDINAPTCYDGSGSYIVDCTYPAGAEGVTNVDATGLVRFDIDASHRIDIEAGYSRQGNIYTGDTQIGFGTDTTEALADAGAETNVLHRYFGALTHYGTYDFGESTSYLQYERTLNTRLIEGASGRYEGAISDDMEFGTTTLDNLTAKTEWDIPSSFLGASTVWTFGGEARIARMDDPVSIEARGDIDFSYGSTEALAADRDPVIWQSLLGLYAEGNIYASDRLTITPSARIDWSNQFGFNPSGSLNASYDISSEWTAKVGLARAFKAPSLDQINPNYVYTTRGNGCPFPYYQDGPCYVLGNPDLAPEVSYNGEIGLGYAGASGVEGTLTAFYNYYTNKIQSGTDQIAQMAGGERVYQWYNIPSAVVAGLEGSFGMPIGDALQFNANATYMAISRNNETGDPLSLVPKYTINASLEWQATDRLSVIPSLTHYGPIEAASTNATTGYAYDDTTGRDPYTVVNLSARYEVNETFSVSGGVTNLFNTEVLRSGNGANTFNEPGRAFYVGLSKTF